jgi:hypothetical protein
MTTAPPAVQSFESSRDHLLAELGWLELVVQREIARTRLERDPEEKFDEFSGMYISEKEISRYLGGDQAPSGRDELVQPNDKLEQMRLKISAAREDLDERIRCTLAAGTGLRIVDLVRSFRLTSQDVFVLLSVMAPDIDVRFQRYFAYLQNDVSKKRPTLQLLNRIWGDGRADRVSVRDEFAPHTTLISGKLLEFQNNAESLPFPGQQPHAADSVIDFLAAVDRLDTRLRSFADLVEPQADALDASHLSRHREVAGRLLAAAGDGAAPPLAYVWGPEGCGKRCVVEATAAALQRWIVRIRWTKLMSAADIRPQLDLLRRDAVLHGCMLHICDIDSVFDQAPAAQTALSTMREFLMLEHPGGVLITGSRPFAEVRNELALPLMGFEIRYPTVEEREQIWKEKLGSHVSESDDEWIRRLSVSFRFTPGQIASVLKSLPRPESVSLKDELFRGCREESNQTLSKFATKIAPRYRWSDLVLPADTQAQLDEICNSVRYRATVFGDWGFESKFSLGKGLNVLFAGPSGTGKTMSAEIIAGNLGLDLFKVDLSSIVSKYVGETERNLSRIFLEAETSNAILFFDEADALFGKRSEVKDAHDRYANIEINYLLQKMDDYEGIVILATNLRSNIDAAFSRRLHHVVEFPFPDESYRETIWRKVFPEQTPVSNNVDFEFLAKRFKLAGGNIKNIALSGAFLAARNGGQVTMEHLIQATKREFQKMGRLCSKSEFGHYYRLLREEVDA